ncbi:MAG: efflux RND transporter periplasmic adaptor subunit [Thalassotalea sp.]
MTRKKQIIVPIAILAIGIGAFAVFSGMKKPPAEKAKVDTTPIVSVQAITLMPMTLKVKSHGVVKAKFETELVAQVSGELIELSADFVRGAFVKKGQVLAKIDPNDYQAALINAEAILASAKASLEQEIAHGKVAEHEWKRIKASSPTQLSLRKPQLAKELSNVKAAEAGVLIAKRNLERTEIKAPYDALIENRSLGLGAYISKGVMIGRVMATDIAEIRLPVAENQLRFLVEQGRAANVEITGSYAGEVTTWQAEIVRSEGVIDQQSRMNYLVAEIKDPYGLVDGKKAIRFGSYINAQIVGETVTNVAVIPRYLLLDNGVPVLDNDNKLRFVDVEIIRQEGKNIIVANGLENGDQLITSALDYPLHGMQLALAEKLELESEQDQTEEALASTTTLASVKEQ